MAVKAPKVETLAKSMAMLDPGYSEQRGLINEQMEGLGAASEVRRERLEGAKVNNFNAINNAATGKGMAFSGIPIHEQADYLSDVFLPGMQDVEAIESSERMQLRGTLADINTQQRTAAISRVDQQKQALNQWNLQQAQLDAQRRQAELDRQFTRSERIASQQFTAGQNAADRAASAASQANVYDTVEAILQGSMGTDRKVSPAAWRQAAAYASRNGLSFSGSKGFANSFWQYANDKHGEDYINGYEKYN